MAGGSPGSEAHVAGAPDDAGAWLALRAAYAAKSAGPTRRGRSRAGWSPAEGSRSRRASPTPAPWSASAGSTRRPRSSAGRGDRAARSGGRCASLGRAAAICGSTTRRRAGLRARATRRRRTRARLRARARARGAAGDRAGHRAYREAVRRAPSFADARLCSRTRSRSIGEHERALGELEALLARERSNEQAARTTARCCSARSPRCARAGCSARRSRSSRGRRSSWRPSSGAARRARPATAEGAAARQIVRYTAPLLEPPRTLDSSNNGPGSGAIEALHLALTRSGPRCARRGRRLQGHGDRRGRPAGAGQLRDGRVAHARARGDRLPDDAGERAVYLAAEGEPLGRLGRRDAAIRERARHRRGARRRAARPPGRPARLASAQGRVRGAAVRRRRAARRQARSSRD